MRYKTLYFYLLLNLLLNFKVLSKKDVRAKYDKYGEEGLKDEMNHGGHDHFSRLGFFNT